MANQKLIEDYMWYFENKIGRAYGLDKEETETLRGVYEKIAKKEADEIRAYIEDLKKKYIENRKAIGFNVGLRDKDVECSLNLAVRKYLADLEKEAIDKYTEAYKNAIIEYDLSTEELCVVEKYWEARWQETAYAIQKELESYKYYVKRYDLQEEDMIDFIAAVSAAYMLL